MAKDPVLEDALARSANKMLVELDKRCKTHRTLDSYYEGSCPLPAAIESAKLTKAYKLLMPLAEAPWGSLVVDSVQDRLEVAGVRSPDGAVDDAVWGMWQDNGMDARSKLAHSSALISGRAFALVWPGADGKPRISLDTAEQMVVLYREGGTDERVAALRRWQDDDELTHVTIYTAKALYKLQEARDQKDSPTEMRIRAGGKWWEPRVSEGEAWLLENPHKVVPVVELAINRRLKPGSFGYARGEFEHCIGLIDRINMLTFLGLVVAFWMGFPLRGVIGDKILRDDDGNALAPFDVKPDAVVQLENPEAKIIQLQAADRKNLSIFPELSQLSTITKTPRHYFPQDGALSNVSADTIRADEGALHAKVKGLHKPFLGEGHEEILRLCGLMSEQKSALSPRAELLWVDHESRSLAERADAYTKLQDLPWTARAEIALGATADQITRWQSERAGDAFTQLLTAATAPAPAPIAA